MKTTSFLLLLLVSNSLFSAVLYKDERELSQIDPVARILTYAWYGVDLKGCTGTMIGRSCMVTAGHCKSFFHTAEFNVPESRNDGSIRHPERVDRYRVDKKSINYLHTMTDVGFDWAVLRLKPNKKTKKWPGDEQGFYKITKKQPSPFSFIRVTGYGKDDLRPNHNRAQQTSLGFIRSYEQIFKEAPGRVIHDVDTEDGSSGSALLLEDSQEIFGIATHHECPVDPKFKNYCKNGGSVIALDKNFQKAINECLTWEEENLK